MGIPPGRSISAAVSQAQEWQRLSLTATNLAMRHYFHGCANLAMAHTPQQALAAAYETQTALLRHWADAFAEVVRLWRKRNTELLSFGPNTRAQRSNRPPSLER